jgi:hypothetical protein
MNRWDAPEDVVAAQISAAREVLGAQPFLRKRSRGQLHIYGPTMSENRAGLLLIKPRCFVERKMAEVPARSRCGRYQGKT